MRTQITDYIEKAIEKSKTEVEEETGPATDDSAQVC